MRGWAKSGRAWRGLIMGGAGLAVVLGTAVGSGVTAASAASPGPTPGQTVTYTKTVTIPTPPASNFAGNSGGDGWGIALSSTQVFNVFHHSTALVFACHNQKDASPCSAANPTKTITDGTIGFSAAGQPGVWLDQANGHLFVFATRNSDQTAGVVCIDTTSAAPDPYCGFTPLSAVGDAPYGSYSGITDPVLVGTNWYAFNYVATAAAPTGTRDKLMCFDTVTLAACAGQPFAVAIGSGAVTAETPSPSIAAIGTQVEIPVSTTGTPGDLLACFDTAKNAACSGSWPVAAPAGYLGNGAFGNGGAGFPMFDAAGAVTGFCLPAPGDPCFSQTGASVATPPGLATAIPENLIWDGPAVVIGTRVYVAVGSFGPTQQVGCYDFAARTTCANFPKVLSNIGYLYTVNPDPYRPTCIWVNSDSGSGQIQNFDAFTGGACGSGPIRILGSSVVVPTDACVPSAWTSLQLLVPARTTYTDGTVQFQDIDGNPIPGVPTQTLDSTGTANLTGLNLSTQLGLPQFLITLIGETQALSTVQVKLTWTGQYLASCVGPGTTVSGGTPGHNAIGYRLQGQDGGVFDYGDSQFYGSLPGIDVSAPIVATANTFDNGGYWLAGSDGSLFAFGDAQYLGNMFGKPLNKPIVGVAGTPDMKGYWLVGADGGVYSFGDAGFYGSTGGITLNQPIVGMAASPTGKGYWLVARDGGVFAFGDAAFHGSMGGVHLNKPVVGMWPTSDGGGYWLAASDGGVFALGDAGFHGSAGNLVLAKPVVGIVADPSGGGYWLMATDGGVFSYGNAPFFGAASQIPPSPLYKPITSAST